MKVAVISSGVLPSPPLLGGAIELHTYYLARELSALGNEVHYVTDISPIASFKKNVTIHQIGYSRGSFSSGFMKSFLTNYLGGWKAWKVTEDLLKSTKVDILHFHHRISGAFYSLSNRDSPVPCVYTVHNPTPSMFSFSARSRIVRAIPFAFLELRLIKRSVAVIVVSKNLKRELTHNYGVNAGKIFYIPNGVDVDAFKTESTTSSTFEKYRVSEPFFLYVGKLDQRKGVHLLLKALAYVEGSLMIVGDGPYKSTLETMVRKLGLENRVFFTGSIPPGELVDLYNAASALVLPSLAEGLPLVVLEAMATGLPVVTTEGIADEVVIDGYNGFTFPRANVEILGDKLASLYTDPKMRKRMSLNSKEIVQRQFSWRVIAEKVADVYDYAIRHA